MFIFHVDCWYCKLISSDLESSIASLRWDEFCYKRSELVVEEQLDFKQRWNEYMMPELCHKSSEWKARNK